MRIARGPHAVLSLCLAWNLNTLHFALPDAHSSSVGREHDAKRRAHCACCLFTHSHWSVSMKFAVKYSAVCVRAQHARAFDRLVTPSLLTYMSSPAACHQPRYGLLL